MSNEENAPVTDLRRVFGCLLKIGLILFLVYFVFGALLGSFGLMDVGISFVFGWISFLNRTAPQISWNWDLVAMSLLCCGLILGLAHGLLKWLVKAIGSARNQSWVWPWRWTYCGLIALALFFLVGMSAGGAAHQIGWIAASDEPWYEGKSRFGRLRSEMTNLEYNFMAMLEKPMPVGAFRREVRETFAKPDMLESFHILLVPTNGTNVTGVIIFPRDPQMREKVGGSCVGQTEEYGQVSARELPDVLKQFQTNLVAF